MQLLGDRLTLSASDFVNFLECGHLTLLDLEYVYGRLPVELKRPDTADLVARKGDEHEQRHLEALRRRWGDRLVEIDASHSHAALLGATTQTRAAMEVGAPAIFQATFLQDGWRGHADFLERVEHPSLLGDWSYEVLDTKLARSVKPDFVIQLCLYSQLVAAIQGTDPQNIHVLLGTGERRSYALADFAAYYRRMRGHFQSEFANGLAATYPDPVPHCGLCRWADLCDARRVEDDHLSLVARMARPQITKLNAAGIQTVAQLATLGADDRPSSVGEGNFERLRQQAPPPGRSAHHREAELRAADARARPGQAAAWVRAAAPAL